MASSSVTFLSKEYERYFTLLKSKGLTSSESVSLLNYVIIKQILLVKEKRKCMDYDGYLLTMFDYAFINANSNLIGELSQEVNKWLIKTNLNSFEKMLGSILEKHINRKKTGSYYTPDDTTKYICWNAIFISILNKLPSEITSKIYQAININNNVEFVDKKLTFEEKIKILKNLLSYSDINKILECIEKLRIIDPTCGSGAFIISAYECIKYLNENLFESRLNPKYYYLNLYGTDITYDAILLTKARLMIKVILDNNLYDNTFIDSLEHYICDDAITGKDYVIGGLTGLDWTLLGRFDCIVGNPPYVEVKNKEDYQFYTTKKCGNLYAYCIERACNIATEKGVVSFVVPLPLIATPRMSPVKKYLEQKSNIVYYCTFADRPGCLFTGVHQRLTIFFASIGEGNCRKFTSSYKFWYKAERDTLFKSIDFIENHNDLMPKIGTNIENSIFVKNQICTDSVYSLSNPKTNNFLYISSRIGFWAKAFLKEPKTNEITVMKFNTEEIKRIVYCFLNSSLFYYMWVITSDCWHVTNSDLKNIKFNYSALTEKQKNRLISLSYELDEDLEKNKVKIDTKQTEYEYKHKLSKKIIDKIDDIVCKNAGLDAFETKFIKNYTLKYRLNKVEENEE